MSTKTIFTINSNVNAFVVRDKNYAIHDCSRVGKAFDRLHGRHLSNDAVAEILADEYDAMTENITKFQVKHVAEFDGKLMLKLHETI